MLEVVDLLLSWLVTTAACFYVVMRDERRLAEAANSKPTRGNGDAVFLAIAQTIFWGGLAFATFTADNEPEDPPWLRGALLVGFLATGLASTPAAFLVARRDAKRVTPELLERAWPPASRAAAIVAFGQIAVWVHFWKTRRFGPRGFLLGLFWTVATLLPGLAVGFVLDLIFGGP